VDGRSRSAPVAAEGIASAKVLERQTNLAKKRRYANRHG
jgi:hypothetical protein